MGFALERLAEAVDPAFQCQLLCGQVLEEPACTPCGHVFCASCLLPWAAGRRWCPLQCQPLAPGELYRVLPLRSLVQQLRVQCNYSGQGCGHRGDCRCWQCTSSAAPSALPAAVTATAQAAAEAAGRKSTRRPRPAGVGTRVRGHPDLEVGLWLSPAVGVGKTRRAQVSLLQRRYQEKLALYMAHTRNFVGNPGGRGQDGEQKPFTVVLEREDDTLGFNIIGGRPYQNSQKQSAPEGIYVSKILENGPADRADGLEVHDKIIATLKELL